MTSARETNPRSGSLRHSVRGRRQRETGERVTHQDHVVQVAPLDLAHHVVDVVLERDLVRGLHVAERTAPGQVQRDHLRHVATSRKQLSVPGLASLKVHTSAVPQRIY